MKHFEDINIRQNVNRFNDLTEAVEGFEDQFAVENWTHDGIAVYPIIRSILLGSAERDLILNSQPIVDSGFTWRRRLQRVLKLVKLDHGVACPWLQDDLLFLSWQSQLRLQYSKRIDPVLEPWVTIANGLSIPIARLNIDGLGRPPTDASLKFLVRAAVSTNSKKFDHRSLDGFEVLKSSALSAAGKNYLDKDVVARAVEDSAGIADFTARAFALKRPAGLIMSSYYNPVGWGLCAGARSAGLAAVDVQHGHQGRRHHAYAWRPRNTRGTLPMPTARLVWQNSLSYGENEIETGAGFLRTLACLAPERIGQLNKFTPQGVLFAAQGPQDSLRLAPLVEALQSRTFVAWRNHPILGGKTPAGAVDMSDLPLTEALAKTLCVATRYSSTALEAATIGKPIVFLDPAGPFYLSSQLGDKAWLELDISDLTAATEMILSLILSQNRGSAQSFASAIARLPDGEALLRRALNFSNC